MKIKIYFLAFVSLLLFNSTSFSQSVNLIKYISFEVGTGITETSIADRDSIANNFGITNKNALYGGIAVKIPYIVPGLYYYENKFELRDRGQTYEISNSYLSLVVLYDLLQVNINNLVFVDLKLGGNASVLIAKKDNGSRFENKSMVFGLNGKLDGTMNVSPTIGLSAGIDYNYNGISDPIIMDNKYKFRMSSFKFFVGLKKYF